ncbi:putative ribonuclease H-like domain-containing protein [Tanacetum coccineum]
MYSVDMKNIVPKESLTCLVAKATLDESMLWHRRLGYVNFKTINKLVKENLVRGLPSKRFENNKTCVACLKGKQHKASYNTARPNLVVVNAVRANQVNVVKALACWVWRPTKLNSASIILKRHNYVDARGRSKNLMEDMLPLGEEPKEGKLLVQKKLLVQSASNDETQPSSDAGKKDDEGVCKESEIADQEKSKNSTQGVNTAGPSINTELDMFSLGDNATATHVDFFGDETEVNMSNITTTYPVPSTPNTRIH